MGSKIPDVPGAIGTGFGNLTGDEDLETVVNRVREEVVEGREPTGEVTQAEGTMSTEGAEQSDYTPPGSERGGEVDARTRPGERSPAGDAQQMTEMDGQTALTRGAQEEPSAEGRTALTRDAEQAEPQVQHPTPGPSGVPQFQSSTLNRTVTAQNIAELNEDELKTLYSEVFDVRRATTRDRAAWQVQRRELLNEFGAVGN